MLSNIYNKLYCIFKVLGYARAASILAREGRHKEAKALIQASDNCKC